MPTFNFYGGIYRDLELILTNAVHFELENEAAGNLLIKTENVSAKSASIDFEARIVNTADKRRKIKLEVDILDPENNRIRTITQELNIRPGGSNKVNITDKLQNPQLWSPDAPNLYKLEARLVDQASGQILDDFNSRFGLRWFEVDTRKRFYAEWGAYKIDWRQPAPGFYGTGKCPAQQPAPQGL
jgi:beta-galactosidase